VLLCLTVRWDNDARVTNERLGIGIFVVDGDDNGGMVEHCRRPASLPLCDFFGNCCEIGLVVKGVICGVWQRGEVRTPGVRGRLRGEVRFVRMRGSSVGRRRRPALLHRCDCCNVCSKDRLIIILLIIVQGGGEWRIAIRRLPCGVGTGTRRVVVAVIVVGIKTDDSGRWICKRNPGRDFT